MDDAIRWALPAIVILGIAVWTEFCVPTRGDEDAPAKIVGLLFLLGLIVWGWSHGELRWPILATLPAAYVWRRLRSLVRLARARRVLLGVTGPFLVLGLLLAGFSTLVGAGFGGGDHVTARAVSPDGRWEARLVEHPGFAYCVDEIVLAPRGLTTLDPTAYPSRSLGETTMESELDHFSWPDPSTLVLFLHPQTPLAPDLTPNPHVAVKVVNLNPPPPDSPSAASSDSPSKSSEGVGSKRPIVLDSSPRE